MLEKGDFLEFTWRDKIRSMVPSYEEIWEKFIGNDGHCHMIQINNMSDDENKKRKNFSQFNYTCLESWICLLEISENVENLKNRKTYISILNNFLAFIAHTGRIKDNLEAMINIYIEHKSEGTKLKNLMEEFWQKRHIVIHGKKVPFKLLGSSVLIPKIRGDKENPEGWNKTMKWSDYTGEFEPLEDYYKSVVTDIANIYEKILQNLKQPIFQLIKEKNINLMFPETTAGKGVSGYDPNGNLPNIGYTPISGSTSL